MLSFLESQIRKRRRTGLYSFSNGEDWRCKYLVKIKIPKFLGLCVAGLSGNNVNLEIMVVR